MSKEITLIHRITGEIQTINLGWSWSIFLFTPLLCIPLLKRHLYISAGCMFGLWSMNILLMLIMRDFGYQPVIFNGIIGLNCVIFTLQFALALKGNEMSVNHYLEMGWKIKE